jgi:hypothetical protein
MAKGYPIAPFVFGQAVLNAATAQKIVSLRWERTGVLITNMSSIDVFFGDSTVLASTGLLLLGLKGAGISIPTTAEIWAIAASGTPTISFMEVYDLQRTP